MRLERPRVQIQLDSARTYLNRLIDGQDSRRAVQISGPKGIGKTLLVEEVFATRGVPLNPIVRSTMAGILEVFFDDPSGYHWLDDYDSWMTDREHVNFFKQILAPGGNPRSSERKHDARRDPGSPLPGEAGQHLQRQCGNAKSHHARSC